MSLVNLFIVGAPKSGTSSLARLFSTHKEIFVPKIKEPAFFCEDKRNDSLSLHNGKNYYFPVDTLNKYEELYKSGGIYKYRLDASVDYFDSFNAAKNISKYNPNSKIIICLRQHKPYLKSLYSEMIKSAGEEIGNFDSNMIAHNIMAYVSI